MKRVAAVILALVILSLAACQTAVPGPISGPADGTSFSEGFRRYVEARMGDNVKSYTVSPISFQYALGMLVAGADGETKGQLLNALGMTDKAFEDYIKEFNSFVEWFDAKKAHDIEEYDRLSEDRKKYETKPAGELQVADSVWKREDLADFLPEYMLRLEMYGAQHFSFTRGDIVRRANAWADEKTNGMIPKILPDDYDPGDLAVLLMNALYYKNGWAYEFRDASKTDFTTVLGKKVDKKFMASTERYRYYKDDETELVVVPMQDKVYMTFVLGNADGLDRKIAEAEYRKVCVTIPKFEIESSLDNGELVGFLKERGATDVFDKEKADLSRMINPAMLKYNLYADDIIQKTKIKLDETGVEAAAVTAVMVGEATSAGRPEQTVYFTADRPFRFFIYSAGQSAGGGAAGSDLTQPRFILFEGMLAE